MLSLLEMRGTNLNLETVNVCSAACVFCASRKFKRRKQLMSMALFQKICCDYKDMGGGWLGFSPVMSDPLLDDLLFDRIRYVQDKGFGFTLHMFTNAIKFKSYSDDELRFVLKSLDMINISLAGPTPESYKLMYGVNQFNNVMDNCTGSPTSGKMNVTAPVWPYIFV
ncbi:MAG: hypothetical protein LBR29_01085 [Methylobacteriaceae bacterium]|jgi:MoaA/NifB/PqqE/SkfB family radical SAM enzyme|nr:hypothetical protein [Methylobacteriaceae bacterium]